MYVFMRACPSKMRAERGWGGGLLRTGVYPWDLADNQGNAIIKTVSKLKDDNNRSTVNCRYKTLFKLHEFRFPTAFFEKQFQMKCKLYSKKNPCG